ncbi:hypothetical protein Bca4012_011217 [Brassica carinata]
MGWSSIDILEPRLGVLPCVRVVLLLRGGDGGDPSARTLRFLLVVWLGSLCDICVCVVSVFSSSVVYGRASGASDDTLRLLIRLTFYTVLSSNFKSRRRSWLFEESVWSLIDGPALFGSFCGAGSACSSRCSRSSSVHRSVQ